MILFSRVLVTEDPLMNWQDMTLEERLVAEQAVATLRALKQAAAEAPRGQGMNVLEAVIHDKGWDHLRRMMTLAAASRPEAQKKGSAARPANADNPASSKG
jgi:hypothetical protein